MPWALKQGMSALMMHYFPTLRLPHEVQPEQVQAPMYHIGWPKQLHRVLLGHLLQRVLVQHGFAMGGAHMNHLEMLTQTRWVMGHTSHKGMGRRNSQVCAKPTNEPAWVVQHLLPEGMCGAVAP